MYPIFSLSSRDCVQNICIKANIGGSCKLAIITVKHHHCRNHAAARSAVQHTWNATPTHMPLDRAGPPLPHSEQTLQASQHTVITDFPHHIHNRGMASANIDKIIVITVQRQHLFPLLIAASTCTLKLLFLLWAYLKTQSSNRRLATQTQLTLRNPPVTPRRQ